MKAKFCIAIAVCALIFAASSAFAVFPPVLVIDGAAAPSVQITGTTGDIYATYATQTGVLILSGTTGGPTASGANSADALANLSNSGTGSWNNGLIVTLPGHTITVPQVLVYYPLTTNTFPAITGYDQNSHPSLGVCVVNGKIIAAYNGLGDGYIFNFNNNNNHIYRYQSGPGPEIINATGGWPPSNTYSFPAQISYNGNTLTVGSVTQGIANGYWSNVYYQSGTTSGQLHVYVAPGVGVMWGTFNSDTVSTEWDPSISNIQANLIAVSGTQGCGTNNVEWKGVILPFGYQDVDGSYVFESSTSTQTVVIDSSNLVTASDPLTTLTGTYNPNTKQFTGINNLAAVKDDGMSLWGIGNTGVWVERSDWDPSGNYLMGLDTSWSNSAYISPDYWFQRPDGTVLVGYISLNHASFVTFNDWYGYGGFSYKYDGTYLHINAVNYWPQGLSASPYGMEWGLNLYLNDIHCNLSGWGTHNYGTYLFNSYDGMPDYDWSDTIYLTTNLSLSSTSLTVNCSGGLYGDYFAGSVDPVAGGVIVSNSGNQIYVSFGPLQLPLFGPPQLCVDGTNATYAGSGSAGDVYNGPQGVNVQIASDHSVQVTNALSQTFTGSYSPSTFEFSLSGSNAPVVLAEGVNGSLLINTPGLVLNLSSTMGLVGQSIRLGDGSTYTRASNIFSVANGPLTVKYLNVPENSLFLSADGNGQFTSPLYHYSGTSNSDFVLNSGSDGLWPESNAYSQSIYMNGHYAPIDGSTEYDLGTVPSRYGGVSYTVETTGETVSINWTWTSGTNSFRAIVSGSYGSFGAFTGTWDGTFFTGLPKGLIISNSLRTSGPSVGFSQISWNGVNLTYDPIASSMSGSNRTGADVFSDAAGLGLSGTIASGTNGSVVTLVGGDGTQYIGTYTPGTTLSSGSFSFPGQLPGNVMPVNNQTSGNPNPPALDHSDEILGNLDVHGNFITMGTWITSGTGSVNALAISYSDTYGSNPSLLRFSATRAFSAWIWSEATADNSNPQVTMMELDPSHRLILSDTTSQNAPTVTLDPNGFSKFKKPLLIAPQGDVKMGIYTTGTSP